MSFAGYTSIDDVIRKHRIRWLPTRFIEPLADAPPFSDFFRSELNFNLNSLPPARNENGASEYILFPIIREVWRTYHDDLSLFSHEPLAYDADLTGCPDYSICKRSEFGPFYPTPPYLLIVEAKLDDFTRAWGQCLAAMLAAQKLNGLPEQSIYGIATNGKSWEFGRLLGTEFMQDTETYTMSTLDLLGQVLHAVFRKCRDMARAATSLTTANA